MLSADDFYTTTSQLKLVAYLGEVAQDQCVSAAGKKMFARGLTGVNVGGCNEKRLRE